MTYLKDKPYFVCLLISAFQFVKDRCVLTSQIKINYRANCKMQQLTRIFSILLFGKYCVVEANGIEPMTPCLQSRCSTN